MHSRLNTDKKNFDILQAIVNGDQLNDNKWHAVRYLRYGAFILLQVDTRNAIKGM